MKKTLGTLAIAALALTACNNAPSGPDPRSSSAPAAIQGRANPPVATTQPSPGSTPTNDSNSASATGGPGTSSRTR